MHLTGEETTEWDDAEDNPGETLKVGDKNMNLASDPEREDPASERSEKENNKNTDNEELIWEIIKVNKIGLWNMMGRMTAEQMYMVARRAVTLIREVTETIVAGVIIAVMAMAAKIIMAIVAKLAMAAGAATVIVAEMAKKARAITVMATVVKMITEIVARKTRMVMARAIVDNVEMEGVGHPMWKYRNKEKMKKSQLTWEVAEGMNEGESKDPEGPDEIQLTWRVAEWNSS